VAQPGVGPTIRVFILPKQAMPWPVGRCSKSGNRARLAASPRLMRHACQFSGRNKDHVRPTHRRHREKRLRNRAVACVTELLERRVFLSSSGQIFVANNAGNTIGEYNFDGTTVNASLASGLNAPFGLAASGSDLFVCNPGSQASANTRPRAPRSTPT